MAEDTVFHTYKKNVGYNVTVRLFPQDFDGVTLNNVFPTVRIGESKIRDFKMSNQRIIREGLIVEVPEESLDWELANALTDEQVSELLKNFPKLKATLPTIDSLPILYKIQNLANERELSKRTRSAIQARIDEVTPEDEEEAEERITKEDMKGTR